MPGVYPRVCGGTGRIGLEVWTLAGIRNGVPSSQFARREGSPRRRPSTI